MHSGRFDLEADFFGVLNDEVGDAVHQRVLHATDGIALGLVAGYRGGAIDGVITTFHDITAERSARTALASIASW